MVTRIIAVGLVVLVSGLMAPSTEAGGGPKPGMTATMWVTPNPPIAAQAFIVRASGLPPGYPVNFVHGSVAHYAVADANGVATDTFTLALPNIGKTIKCKTIVRRKWVRVGSMTFDVVAP